MKRQLITCCLGIISIFITPGLLVADESQPEVKAIRVNGYEMSYVERGSGKPLVLVHGALSDYRTWLPLLKEFSEGNRTIAVSLRHYYPEQWEGKGDDLTLQQHADDMAAFIRALNIGPVSLLGHSRGAAVSLLMTSQHPELVNKLILADPTPLTAILANRPDIQADVDTLKTKLQEVIHYYRQGDPEGGLRSYVNHIAGQNAWEKTSEARRSTLRSNIWTQTSLLRDIETAFSCNMAAKISAPVLLITGDRSSKLHGHMQDALRPCIKQVNNATIADAGHMMFHANPTAFVFEVQDFILPQ